MSAPRADQQQPLSRASQHNPQSHFVQTSSNDPIVPPPPIQRHIFPSVDPPSVAALGTPMPSRLQSHHHHDPAHPPASTTMRRFTRHEDLIGLEFSSLGRLDLAVSTAATSDSRIQRDPTYNINSANDHFSPQQTPTMATAPRSPPFLTSLAAPGLDEQDGHGGPMASLIYPTDTLEAYVPPSRQYIEAHTTFLSSAEDYSTGIIPEPQTTMMARLDGDPQLQQHQQQQYHHHHHNHRTHFAHHQQQHQHYHHPLNQPSPMSNSYSGTPLHYPASLLDDSDGLTPGSPHSVLSEIATGSSGGMFHVGRSRDDGAHDGTSAQSSRPLSRTGYILDQASSSLNLIMPSSAMFLTGAGAGGPTTPPLVHHRSSTNRHNYRRLRTDPTLMGQAMGHVKLLVCGESRLGKMRLVQSMFEGWEDVVACDFDQEQEGSLESSYRWMLGPDTLKRSESSADRTTATTNSGTGASSSEQGESRMGGSLYQDDADDESGLSQLDRSADDVSETAHGTRHFQESGSSGASSASHLQEGRSQPPPPRTMDTYLTAKFASTMVLPEWARSEYEIETHRDALVKNISIIETVGNFSRIIPQRHMDPVISYLGLQFQTTNEYFSRSVASDDSLGRFLSDTNMHGAHSHVDLCIYVMVDEPTALDIMFLQRLDSFVNILPVLMIKDNEMDSGMNKQSRADMAREMMMKKLKDHDIGYFRPKSKISAQVPAPGESDETHSFECPFVFHLPNALTEAENTSSDPNASLESLLDGDTSPIIGGQLSAVSSTSPANSQQRPGYEIANAEEMQRMRQWIFNVHLSELRHQTTVKFLTWRSHLATMAGSSSYGSSLASYPHALGTFSHQSHHPLYHQHSSSSIRSTSTKPVSESLIVSPTHSPRPQPRNNHHHFQQLNFKSPTELLMHLRSLDQKRLWGDVVQLLHDPAKELEQIVREKHQIWRRALEEMERSTRMDFLVSELKRWATEGEGQFRFPTGADQAPQPQHVQPNRPPAGEQAVGVGLGLDFALGLDQHQQQQHGATLTMQTVHTTRDGHIALPDPDSTGSGTGSSTLKHSQHQARRSSRVSRRGRTSGSVERGLHLDDQPPFDHDHHDHHDPLGMVRLGKAMNTLGHGFLHLVVMMGMGTVATWIYTTFLESVKIDIWFLS